MWSRDLFSSQGVATDEMMICDDINQCVHLVQIFVNFVCYSNMYLTSGRVVAGQQATVGNFHLAVGSREPRQAVARVTPLARVGASGAVSTRSVVRAEVQI